MVSWRAEVTRLIVLLAVLHTGCAGRTPPVAPPTAVSPIDEAETLEEFQDEIDEYVELRHTLESQLPSVPPQAAPEQVHAHVIALGERIISARQRAKQGDMFFRQIDSLIRQRAQAVFVGSDDLQAGTLEMEELARLMSYRGRVAIMVGELASNGAQLRTKAVEIVVAKYPGMKVVEKQVGNFQRERGLDLMNNWLTAGAGIDAVASNNDEMAIGAIMAIQQAGVAPGKILVGGVDATPDALAEVAKGTLAVTVFQNARGQARGALDAAVKLSRKEPVDSFVSIPFELVTRENYKSFLDR